MRCDCVRMGISQIWTSQRHIEIFGWWPPIVYLHRPIFFMGVAALLGWEDVRLYLMFVMQYRFK